MTDFWKNKKVLTYIALAHHTRFISPVMEKLSQQGAKIKYIVGQAERSQEITAITLGLDYNHIFDYVNDNDKNDIEKNYNLLRAAFTNNLKNTVLFGTSPVTVIDKTIHATAVEYIGFKNLLIKEKPDLCFALHEINRWSKMLAFWAKKNNVPFISLQEGLSYDLDFGYSGHAQYSTLNLVWGERVKKKMVSFEAPGSKIIPVGNIHLSNEIAYQKNNRRREIKKKEYKISNDSVILLILSAILPNPTLFFPFFKTISKSKDQALFVKFHPACKKNNISKWIETIKREFAKNIHFIHSEENTYDLMSMADLCVLGQPSTTGLEAIAFGKPLVKMDFAYSPNAPYSFVDQGVAIKMSAVQLANALSEKKDFSKIIDKEKIKNFLKNELTETVSAVDTVSHIFKKTILANKTSQSPLCGVDKNPTKKWSIIIQVPEDGDLFLAQLESLAFNSKGQGEYEILILEPEKKSEQTTKILESLSGDLKRIVISPDKKNSELMNEAGKIANGENLLFFEKNLAPVKGWLGCLDKAFSRYGPDRLFGAQISDPNGKIANAGTVIDNNNAPVSAYLHLNMDFPAAQKERSFQMVDYFIAIKKNLFLNIGGFSPDAGKYVFLDICLKASEYTSNINTVIHLPKLKMIFLDNIPKKENPYDSIYFYSRWHGYLWNSEKALYEQDGISAKDLSSARMNAAMQTG